MAEELAEPFEDILSDDEANISFILVRMSSIDHHVLMLTLISSLQCFDAVVSVTGRTSGL